MHGLRLGKKLYTKKLKLMPSKNAPSRKKSKGYYAKVKKGSGTGKKAGGGMTAKGVKKVP